MASESLQTLSRVLDVPERTLRRAAAEGLIHGERISPRRFRTTFREEAYLQAHWGLLRTLRAALRTEPSVRLAVLFGSQARGTATARSDIDLLVSVEEGSASHIAAITARLEGRLGRSVQLVRIDDARRAPSLLADALGHGRVLVDRDGRWQSLKSHEADWARRAATAEVSLEDLAVDLDLD